MKTSASPPSASMTNCRWFSWIRCLMLACAMAPVAFAQNDQLEVNFSGALIIGCPMTITITSKCGDFIRTPTFKFGGADVPIEGMGDGRFRGYVTPEVSGSIEYSASNFCKSLRKTIEIKAINITKTVTFRDPASQPGFPVRTLPSPTVKLSRESLRSRARITLTYDTCEEDVSQRISRTVEVAESGVSTELFSPHSRIEPTLADKRQIDQTGININGWTGWARYIIVSWDASCAYSLVAAQPRVW